MYLDPGSGNFTIQLSIVTISIILVIVVSSFLKKRKQIPYPAKQVIVDLENDKIRSLISKLGSQWNSEWADAKSQLIALGEKAIPSLLYFINNNNQVLSAPLSPDRDSTIDAVRRAIYILGDVGNAKVISELYIYTISEAPEWSKAATVAIAKIKAKEDSNIHLDFSMPYEQIAQLWTTIVQEREQIYHPEKLYQYCTEIMQVMPSLQFVSINKKAAAWAMLGSLFYKSLHPEWDGSSSTKRTPCVESWKCYDEALQLINENSPNYKFWSDWKEQFSPEPPNKSIKKKASGSLKTDDLGTRVTSFQQANGLTQRMRNGKPIPYMTYIYPNEKTAINSLKQLSFIKTDNNSGDIISTEILDYGYYEINETVYHTFICGFDIKPKVWNEAKRVFEKNNGRLLNSVEPEKSTPKKRRSEKGDDVVFVREYQELKTVLANKITMTYRIYRAGNAEAAMQYLNNNPVHKNYLYIVIETPDGNFCRDIDGIYKE